MTLTTLFFVFRKYSTYLLVTRLSESWFVEAGLANPHEQNKIPRYFVEKETKGKVSKIMYENPPVVKKLATNLRVEINHLLVF